MASQRDTSPLPSDLGELRNLISSLSDDLALQRTIYASLQELTQDEDIQAQLNEAKTEIKTIQTRLSAARSAQYHAQKAANPKSATPSTQRIHNSQVQSSDFAGGSQPSNNTSGLSRSRMPNNQPANGGIGNDSSRPSTPSRKRTYSHANVTPSRPAQYKARRSNESQPTGFDSSPATGQSSDRDDVSVIDLTGDDEEMYKQLDEQLNRHRRNKDIADRDALVARQLQDDGIAFVASSASRPPPGSNSHPGQSAPNYFDRMIPHRSTQTVTPYSSQVGPPYNGVIMNIPERPSPRSAQFTNYRDAPLMPGAYVDSDEERENELGNLVGAGSGAGVLSVPRSPNGRLSFSQAIAAADASRQAAMVRDMNSSASMTGRLQAARNYMNSYRPWQPDVSGHGAAFPPADPRSWQAQLESQGLAAYSPYGNPSQRPGYVAGGMTNPLEQSLSNRFTSGRSVYESQAPGPGAGLSSVITRTNGYDYHGMTDAAGNPLDDRLTNYIADVMDDPRKTAEEIHDLLSNIRPDMEIPAEERGETPEALKYPLYTHQQVALKWMSGMEEGTSKGGILADDMGLGKTISTLSLMVTRKSPTSTKTNLIVGPVALVKQWESEIRKKLKPEHRLSVYLYHQKKMQYSDLKTFDVVLTTYGKVASEHKRYTKHLEARSDSPQYNAYDDLALQRTCPLVHPRSKFYRVILDEAQCIKNRLTMSSQGCDRLNAEYRWCLTGTPMMNGVEELFPLIRFLKIRPYNSLVNFTSAFGGLTAKKYTSEVQKEKSMQQLRIVLKAIMLRRMKDSKIDGKPILELPPKTEEIQNCIFSPDEQTFYRELETKSQVTLSRYLRAGTVGKNYSHVLVLLLRLRQACCHPHLNMDVEYAGNTDVPVEDMESFAKKMDEAVVARIKAAESFECPICFDPVVDPTIFFPCGHDTCAECFTSLADNALMVQVQSGQEGEATPICPQCRATVNPKEVLNYTVFKKVHMPETVTDAPEKDVAAAAEDEDDDDDDTDSDDDESEASDDDADENGDLRDFIVADEEEEMASEAESQTVDNDANDEVQPGSASAESSKKAKKSKKGRKAKKAKKGRKGKGKADEVQPHMLTTLRKEASKNREARKRYMRYLRKNWEPSAKTTKVCELLREIVPSGEKTIIFSQWTALLDLLEIPIKHELGIKYCRYDGGMSRTERDGAITKFVEDPDVKVILVSLKAGNAGLNLTVASHVIICDPFWNPFIEMQAVDRAHRIGQQLPVRVHRVLVKGSDADGDKASGGGGEDGDLVNGLGETVEDRIVKLQEKKRGLINAALDEGESKNLGRLSEQELRYLFGVPSHR